MTTTNIILLVQTIANVVAAIAQVWEACRRS